MQQITVISILSLKLSVSTSSAFALKSNVLRIQKTVGSSNDCDKPLILTPFIKEGKIDEAQSLSKVHLKDVEDIESYSGFFTVNKTCDSNMFFWFFPTERKNASDPIIIWLQGGPGASSLDGLVEEIGPFYIENGNKLKKRQYYWSDKYNVLYFDNPVGTGFSFTNNLSECYAHNEDDVRINLYNALVQFYELFPDLKKNELYVFGESYAGKYIPALAYSIYENNKVAGSKINLKGLGIGDGYSDPISMQHYSSILYNAGVINHKGKMELQAIEKKIVEAIAKDNWGHANLLRATWMRAFESIGVTDFYNYLRSEAPAISYFNEADVKCALHAANIEYSELSGIVFYYMGLDIQKSVKPWVEELLEHYHIMFYNGQLDVIVGAVLTQNFLQTLKWSGAENFKNESQTLIMENDELIGWKTEYGNLRECRIRNAGHMVPADQPKGMYYVMDDFIKHVSQTKLYSLDD